MSVVFDLPADRPAGLRRPQAVELILARVDTTDPSIWSWDGFAQPYHRFGPLSGSFRVRYAGWTPRTALPERFPERRIPEGDADLRLVTLRGRVRMLDLTSEKVLDTFGIDERISAGRLPQIRSRERPDPLLDACGRLTDLLAGWWDDVHAIRYRSSTTPSQTNIAFCQHADLELDAVPLAAATDVLVRAVVGDGFSVPVSWLASPDNRDGRVRGSVRDGSRGVAATAAATWRLRALRAPSRTVDSVGLAAQWPPGGLA